MNETQRRLANCFLLVFPDLSRDSISGASTATVEAWDSVAAITLMNVIEDEFGLAMDLDALAEFDSFQNLHAHLQTRLPMRELHCLIVV